MQSRSPSSSSLPSHPRKSRTKQPRSTILNNQASTLGNTNHESEDSEEPVSKDSNTSVRAPLRGVSPESPIPVTTQNFARSYLCKICGRCLKSLAGLIYHEKTHWRERGEDVVWCTEDGCQRFYSRQQDMARHRSAVSVSGIADRIHLSHFVTVSSDRFKAAARA